MKLNLTLAAVLAVLMFVFATTTVQADDLSALVQSNLGYIYGHTGYDGGYYSATDYAHYRLANGPGGYGYNRRNRRDNGWETVGKIAVGFGAGVLVGRHSGREPEVEYRLPPSQPSQEPRPEKQTTPPPATSGVQVVNETGCTAVVYAGNEQFMLKPGEMLQTKTDFQAITAWGKFTGDEKLVEGQVLQGKDGVVRIKAPV